MKESDEPRANIICFYPSINLLKSIMPHSITLDLVGQGLCSAASHPRQYVPSTIITSDSRIWLQIGAVPSQSRTRFARPGVTYISPRIWGRHKKPRVPQARRMPMVAGINLLHGPGRKGLGRGMFCASVRGNGARIQEVRS